MTTRIGLQEQFVQTFTKVIDQGFNAGNLTELDPLFHPDFVEHQRGFPTPDLDGLKRGIVSLRRAIPDIHLEVADTIIEDDKVCFRLEGTGTHKGRLGPLPGTGTSLTLSVIDICRFEGSQIIEHWGIPDQMGIMEQIGLPQPPRWIMGLLMRRRKKSVQRP